MYPYSNFGKAMLDVVDAVQEAIEESIIYVEDCESGEYSATLSESQVFVFVNDAAIIDMTDILKWDREESLANAVVESLSIARDFVSTHKYKIARQVRKCLKGEQVKPLGSLDFFGY